MTGKSWLFFNFYNLQLNLPDGITYVEAYSKLPPVNYSLADCKKTDVQYRLFTKDDDSKGKLVTEETVNLTAEERDLPTKLFIHGWTTNETSYWYGPLRNAYLNSAPHNILYIDWSPAGSKPFEISAANVDPIGGFIADFLIASKISLDKIHVIGHSLGSHVAGFIGKHVFKKSGKKIGRITATDPAGPTFEHKSITEELRLSEGDALFVDVVHTDAGHYGFIAPIGHVDYYPNGGRLQPGCPDLIEDGWFIMFFRKNYFGNVLNFFQIIVVMPGQICFLSNQ